MPLSCAPSASIIIPVFNQLSYTQKCIESLRTVDEPTPFEIIVVNNGSTDGTVEYLENARAELQGALRVIDLPENQGYAQANNLGAEQALGEHLVFLNNDTLLTAKWLSGLITMAGRRHVGVVGPKLVFPDTKTINHAGYAYNAEAALFYAIYANQPIDLPHLNRTLEVQALLGACLLVPASVYREVGGMDHLGLEDIDFCLRVRKAGYRVIYAPESMVYHYGSVTVLGSPSGSIPVVTNSEFVRRWPKAWLAGDDIERYERDGFIFEGFDSEGARLRPLIVEAYQHLTRSYELRLSGASREAEEELHKALAIHPHNAEVWQELLRLPHVRHDTGHAVRLARMAVGQAAHSVDVLLEAARTFASSAHGDGNPEFLRDARQAYEMVIAHDLFPDEQRGVAAAELALLPAASR